LLQLQKDIFHEQKRVLESTEGASHELNVQFTRGLSNAALKYEEKSKTDITRYTIEQDKMKIPVDLTRVQVVFSSLLLMLTFHVACS
jgi:hypothetical protein